MAVCRVFRMRLYTLLMALLIISFPSLSFATVYFQTPHITLHLRENSPYNIGRSSEFVSLRVLCALNEMKMKYRTKEVPWKRAQDNVTKGISQAFYPAGLNQKREILYHRSNAINHGRIYWLIHKELNLNPHHEMFQQIPVVVVGGTRASKWIKARHHNVIEVSDHIGLIGMLVLKRVRIGLLSDASLNDHRNTKLDISEFNVSTAYERKQFVFFSKSFINANPKFLNRFNSHLIMCIRQHPNRTSTL